MSVTGSVVSIRMPEYSPPTTQWNMMVPCNQWLYRDTGDSAQVADFAESILWLVIPSCALFLVLPTLLRRGVGFEVAMIAGIAVTVLLYGIGIYAAQSYGNVS